MTAEPTAPPEPLRIGLLLDDVTADAHVRRFVERIRSHDGLQVTHLVLHPRASAATGRKGRLGGLFDRIRRRGLSELIAKATHRLLVHCERRLLQLLGRQLEQFELCDIAERFSLPTLSLVPLVSTTGFVYRFSEADVRRVRECRFDVLLRFGSGILRGDILRAAEFGVLSFHHGDNDVNRGGPPGFWEVRHGADASGFVIQQLTDELDGGHVFVRGHIPTRSPYLSNQDALYRHAFPHLERLLLRIAATRRLPALLPAYPYAFPLRRAPGPFDATAYVLRQSAHWSRRVLRRIAGRRYRWSVGYQAGDWRTAVLWKARVIENPAGRFLADPFVVTWQGQTCIFVEDYDYATAIGCIAAYVIEDGEARRVGVALAEPFHLSFPYVFEFEGQLYLCPESQAAAEIRIYRCLEFPLRWTLCATPMRGVDAVDTMIFRHGGKWWLATNIGRGSADEHYSELHLFSADHPLHGGWVPHPHNPVCIDSRKARNGGILRDGEVLFRIGQRQGLDQYGRAVSLNRIESLSETDYLERTERSLSAGFVPRGVGLHHMHSNGAWTVFDFARYHRIALGSAADAATTRPYK